MTNTTTPPPSIIALIEDYLTKTQLGPGTVDKYRGILRRWASAELTDVTGPADLTITHAELFLVDAAELAPTSRKVYAAALLGFFRHLELRELTAISTAKLKLILNNLVGKHSPILHDYDPADLEAIVELARSLTEAETSTPADRLIALRDYALLTTLADTGLRIAEACALRRGDIQWHTQPPRVRITGKGDKERVVFFSPRAVAAIQAYLAAREDNRANTPVFTGHGKQNKTPLPLSTDMAWRSVKHLAYLALPSGRAAGIHPHTFRHHFLTTVWRKTNDLHLAQLLAGHASVQTTTGYTHASIDDLAQRYTQVFQGEPNV